VAIIANSTISENPIGVESIASPTSDLKLEAFSAVSRTFVVDDTAVLTLSNGVDEVISPKNYSDVVGIPGLAATDIVSVIINFVESREKQLSLNDEETITASFKFIDNIPLRLVAFEKPDDDVASEDWRLYPGLPIQPIGYSPIASEQFDINFRSFSDIASVGVELTAFDNIQIVLNSIDSPLVEISDQDLTSFTQVYDDQGNLGVFSFASKEIYLNSEETGLLEISAEDQVKQVFSYAEVANFDLNAEFTTNSALNSFDETISTISAEAQFTTLLNSIDAGDLNISLDPTISATLSYIDSADTSIIGFDQTSISYFSYEDGAVSITARTFEKEYTFLQQEFIKDTINLKIEIESDAVYVESRGEVISRQFWIG
jgi:hypothetical protein